MDYESPPIDPGNGTRQTPTPWSASFRFLLGLRTIATSGKLNVVLGEKGLAERVVNLL